LTLSYVPPGGRVADLFAGTATFTVAAKRLGRKSVWVEQNPDFFAKADSRIEAEPFPDLDTQATRDSLRQTIAPSLPGAIAPHAEAEPIPESDREPLEDLTLSVHVFNTLKRQQINYVADLLKLNKAELSQFKNMGEASVKEVVDALRVRGLSLRESTAEAESQTSTRTRARKEKVKT